MNVHVYLYGNRIINKVIFCKATKAARFIKKTISVNGPTENAIII
jgi:hypothetical protein